MSLAAAAFMLAGVTANPAMAQDKAKAEKGKAAKLEATSKVLLDNAKVRVIETTWKPGAQTASATRTARVIRALKAGTLTRIYADGKTEKSPYKTGEAKYFEADAAPYVLKNEGKTDMVTYAVFLK